MSRLTDAAKSLSYAATAGIKMVHEIPVDMPIDAQVMHLKAQVLALWTVVGVFADEIAKEE